MHSIECFHIHNTDIDNIGWFETHCSAYEQGYRLCKHCNPLFKHYKKECNEITDFCRKNGLSVRLGNSYIFIYSIRSKWKIVISKNKQIVLYHKNDFKTNKDHLSEISGYHLQRDVLKNSIVDYLDYIVKHDYYRMLNPIYIPKNKKEKSAPRKGTKRYKRAQRKIEKYKHKQAIKNVLNLIDSINIQSTSIPVLAT